MDTVNNKRRRTANEGTERETKIPKDDLKLSTNKTKDEPSRPKRKQPAEKNKSKAKKSKAIKAGITVERAKTAAKLAEALMKDPEKASALVLRMTLDRKTSKVAPNTWPPRNTVIPKSFVWANYPPLEAGTFNTNFALDLISGNTDTLSLLLSKYNHMSCSSADGARGRFLPTLHLRDAN